MASPGPGDIAQYVEEVIHIYRVMQGTKYLSVIASTILLVDMITTLPSEIVYIWGSSWTFVRIMFHINRAFSLVLLGVYVPTLFMYRLTEESHDRLSLFYTYGTIFVMCIITSVLIVRIWLIYGKKTWFLLVLIASALGVTVPTLVLFQISLMKSQWIPNPAPDVITACLFTPNPIAFLPYITGLLYETLIFSLTVYKTWKLNRQSMTTPLIIRLFTDGSSYYVVVVLSGIFTCLGALHPLISGAAIGSGWLLAMMSSMCSRLILSTRAFYNKDEDLTNDFVSHEMESLPRVPPRSDPESTTVSSFIQMGRPGFDYSWPYQDPLDVRAPNSPHFARRRSGEYSRDEKC
ncbi:F-box-like domain protein [Ceratobasidium sp. AG-Ba]|nr:F-box-like domain protein [Ceratobasidium sp. AG-Ba]